MIDLVYQTLLVLINKEIQGYISPDEFNKMAALVQYEIYCSYFDGENDDKNKENRGVSNRGYANLAFKQRQKLNQFTAEAESTILNGFFDLPSDQYIIEDDGVYLKEFTIDGEVDTSKEGVVIEEAQRKELGYLLLSEAKPTVLYPVYERYADKIKVYPNTISKVGIRYLRKPLNPVWSYFKMPDGSPKFNPSASDYQDFELHDSEFPTIVLKLLSYSGVNLRETDVIQAAELIKNNNKQKYQR